VDAPTPKPAPIPDLLLLAGISLGLVLFHLLTSALSGYGYFIDELYFIACSHRLALGYVDQPPLSIGLLALSRWMLGASLPAVRVLPALAMGGTVFMTGLLARQLGGSRRAVVLSALAALVMPVYLVFGSFYSMNAFEPLIWTSITWLAIRLVQEDEPRYWLPMGVLMGVGLEMKHTLVLYGLALLLGMLLTDARRHLWSRWFLAGILACAALTAPNLAWQVQHGFPSLELYRNSMGSKNIARMPWSVLGDQVLFANPIGVPLWVAGFGFFLLADGRKYRFLAWMALALLLLMMLARSSRPDRISAMYSALYAGGAVAFDRIRSPGLRRNAWATAVTALVLGGLVLLPMSAPVLPPPVLRSYLAALGVRFDIERGKMNEPLPQWLADRLGWRELAVKVAEVYRSLPPEEQRTTVLFSSSYGGAGALELYGPGLGLPPVFSTHNSFHDWGPPSDAMRTYIGVQVAREDLEGRFESVVEAGVVTCELCTRPQRRIPILVARGPRFSVTQEWPRFRNYH
jgi:hypothetical protein